MKKWKQALALVLALVMALSLVALPSFAEGEETGGGTAATQPVWPAEGSINLIKDAQPVEDEDGVYEITLTIQGKNYKTTSDVVLVIDCSGSMEGSKLTNTRAAAKAFGEKLLTEGSTTRIAIVTYADTAAKYNDGHFYTASELNAFENAIDVATYANGGTNQQAGIHAAQELLSSDASTGKLKNMVILSDGAPTYSYRLTGTATGTCTKFIVWNHNSDYEENTLAITGCDYTRVGDGYADNQTGEPSYGNDGQARLTLTCSHGKTKQTDVDIEHSVATIWEANQAKAAGTTIFSVALQAGTYGENTLKGCATDPTAGYFAIAQNDNVETKLNAAFTAIAGSIAKAATNGSVVDPMSDYVGLDFAGDPTYTNDYAAYANKQYDVYLSQGTVTRSGNTLNWTVGDISEGQDAVMKYRVKLNDGLEKGKTYPTNQATTFHYTDYQDQETSRDFNIPEVAPNGGTILIHYYLVNANGQPINAGGTVVDSPDKAQVLSAQEYYTVNNSQALDYGTYQVSKKDIDGSNYYGYTLNGRDKNNPGVQSREATAEVAVATTNANREVWFAYTQSFYVAHV